LRRGEQLFGGDPEGGRAVVERAYSYHLVDRPDDAMRLFRKFEQWATSEFRSDQ
jgi:hypothetical protein